MDTGIRRERLTCIICPKGCEIEVTLDGNDITAIEGNTCPRGEEYARAEVTHPVRQITSTVVIRNGLYERLPVILSGSIPKDRMMDVMEALNSASVVAPVKMGDIIIEDVCGLGVNVIASRSMIDSGANYEG